MQDFSNRPPGDKPTGKDLGNAGCSTGVEDSYGVGSGSLESGIHQRQSITGATCSDGKGER